VNVFLGLGLPWVMANCYELFVQKRPEGKYFVPAGSLGFSVVVFICCALICVITLLVRRSVLGGELGGGPTGRYGTLAFLVSLWILYIVLSILQAYKVGDKKMWESMTFGIQGGVSCPYPK
jgi:solute carrier family 8 (sodium/calcium exchanger)